MKRFTVIDGGARYGIHPTWTRLTDFADFELFEVDVEEASRLKEQYSDRDNVRIHNYALWNLDGHLELNVTAHKGLITAFSPDHDHLESRDYMVDDWKVDDRVRVESRRLDGFHFESTPRFMKLDVEGAEINVLEGAQNLLNQDLLGVRSEVFFAPLLRGVPQFGDVNEALCSTGMELLNLDYRGRGAPLSVFTEEDAYGQLVSSDGVWIRPIDSVLDRNDWQECVLPLAAFLFENAASDAACALLLEARKRYNYCVISDMDEPLGQWIRREIRALLKKLSYSPHFNVSDLRRASTNLLDESYMEGHRFWQEAEMEPPTPESWTMQRS